MESKGDDVRTYIHTYKAPLRFDLNNCFSLQREAMSMPSAKAMLGDRRNLLDLIGDCRNPLDLISGFVLLVIRMAFFAFGIDTAWRWRETVTRDLEEP